MVFGEFIVFVFYVALHTVFLSLEDRFGILAGVLKLSVFEGEFAKRLFDLLEAGQFRLLL